MRPESELCFNGVTDDWQTHWQAIRKFIKYWHNISLEPSPMTDEQLNKLTPPFKEPIPGAVAEWVRFGVELDTNADMVLRDVFQLDCYGNTHGFGIMMQAERDYVWVIKHDDITHENPPHLGHWKRF